MPRCDRVLGQVLTAQPPPSEELVQRVNETFIMMNNRHRPGLKSGGGGSSSYHATATTLSITTDTVLSQIDCAQIIA
jgi:hypothetical protein